MKITTAQDDASAYAISERMRVQMRSLNQANQNTQTDMALLKTAKGAVSSTLELVKTMKEKAIDAANDSNTDQDRQTIQKELDQYIDQVDDNALITFNNKHLLLGDSASMHLHELTDQEAVTRGLASAWISDALTLIEESYGLSFEQDGNRFHAMDVKFVGGDTGITVGSSRDYPEGFSSATAWCGGSTDHPDRLQLTINLDQVKDMDIRSPSGIFYGGTGFSSEDDGANNFIQPYNGDDDDDTDNKRTGGSALDRVIAHELTHGIMQSKFDQFNSLSSWIVEGGTAELTHGADERAGLASYVSSGEAMAGVFALEGTGAAAADAYGGGFVAMRYFAKQSSHTNGYAQDVIKKFMGVLSAGMSANDAFNVASGGKYKSQYDFQESMKADINSYIAGGGTASGFLKEKCGININNTDTGAITGSDAGGRADKTNTSVVPQASSPVNWSLPASDMTVIKGLEVYWPTGYSAGPTGGSLVFHTGAGANQSMHVGLFDMRAKSIGLIDEEGNKLDVSTIGKANQAIGLLDKIANVVLDEATNIGSLLSRLEYTSSNITVSSENVQGAESTIRDADMAKEMTEYTKNNVLIQASQSMLAQANQSSSNVLSLIQ